MKRDFTQLYSQLGLRPDCTLEEFQQAYRRCIARLHPDKALHGGPDNDGLPDLIGLYTTASRFHRRHGRLPGAHPTRNPGLRTALPQAPRQPLAAAAVRQRPSIPDAPTPRTTQPIDVAAPSSRSAPLLAGLAVAALLVLALSWDWPAPAEDDAADAAVAAQSASATEHAGLLAIAEQIQLGMAEDRVLAIQGKPLAVNNDQWDYGPSWLRFSEGRLVDWHSSPLRPLKTASASPTWEPSR